MNSLKQIINRFETGKQTDNDLELLSQLLENPKAKEQVAKYISNIDRIYNSHIGDKLTIDLNKDILQAILDELAPKCRDQGRKKSKFFTCFTVVLSFSLLVVFVLFTVFSLIIPESHLVDRLVVSTIGTVLFVLIVHTILNRVSYFQGDFLSNLITYKYSRTVYLLGLGTVFWLFIFFLSSSHYLFYIVDNSGSMGTCPVWNGTKCLKVLPNSDKLPVNRVTQYLYSKVEKDEELGSEDVPESSLPFLPFVKLNPDIKVGLIEIGNGNGTKKSPPGECIANVEANK